MRVVLVSTYDLGRQPFGLASPAAWLRARGHDVVTTGTSVSPLSPKSLRDADFQAFHLPMHTATRSAVPLILRARELNPRATLIAYGLYAPLNAQFLRQLGVSAILGGEFEQALLDVVECRPPADLISLARLPFLPPDRSTLPALHRYSPLVIDGQRLPAGATEASRGCKHLCRHCPIVPLYQGAFRVVPLHVVLADIRSQVSAGARHISFGDPDFLNGPAHALRIAAALHAEWPDLTFDATIKIQHILRHRALLPELAASGCLFITSASSSLPVRSSSNCPMCPLSSMASTPPASSIAGGTPTHASTHSPPTCFE